jgi:hypothetical protein
MPLSFDLDLVNYPKEEQIRDCMNDPIEWINVPGNNWEQNRKRTKYEQEIQKLLEPYQGLPLEQIIVDTEHPIPLIENIGIKRCERYPKKKCAFIKQRYCKDKYGSDKSETELLDGSFLGILYHDFYAKRRRMNPFARQTRKATVNPNRQLLINTRPGFSRKKEAEIQDLIQNIKTMMLESESESSPYRTRTRTRTRSRITPLSPRQTRSRTRAARK